MAGLEIRPVKDLAGLKRFVRFPWRVYKGDPNWIPPLRSIQEQLLNPEIHPFWERAERELLMAYRGSRPVGRICALIDHNANEYASEKGSAFGFFECQEDPEAAMALFTAAEEWAGDRGAEFVRGPLNPSTNYEVGLLIQGFETAPSFMLPYNPVYYLDLVRLSGYAKEKDLLTYIADGGMEIPEWGRELLERVRERSEFRVRLGDHDRMEDEIRLLNKIYREAWKDNWGFVPMSEAELQESIKALYPIMKDSEIMFFEHEEETVGAAMAVPNINPILKKCNGRGGLWALLQFKLHPPIKGARGLLFGILPEYRQAGIGAQLYDFYLEDEKTIRSLWIEMGWMLEDNLAMNLFFEEDAGLIPARQYRIYRKDL